MTSQDIARINELARKAKASALTAQEKAEQAALRNAYVAELRGSLEGQLKNIVIVDNKGNKTKLQKK